MWYLKNIQDLGKAMPLVKYLSTPTMLVSNINSNAVEIVQH